MNLAQIKQQEKKLEKEREKVFTKLEGRIVLGFKLSRYTKHVTLKPYYNKRQGKRDKNYFYWQAAKCKNGQRLYIYVGTDPRKAKEKILEYFEKHPEKRKLYAETLEE